jgi:hypothetical protein
MGAPVSSRKVIILLSSDLIRHTQITSSRTSTQWNATSPNITRATGGITRDSRTSRLNATYNQSRQRDQHTKESRRQQTPARQTIGESRSVGGSTCGLGPYDRCLRSIRQRGRTTVAGSTRSRERVFEDMDPGRTGVIRRSVAVRHQGHRARPEHQPGDSVSGPTTLGQGTEGSVGPRGRRPPRLPCPCRRRRPGHRAADWCGQDSGRHAGQSTPAGPTLTA